MYSGKDDKRIIREMKALIEALKKGELKKADRIIKKQLHREIWNTKCDFNFPLI